MTDETIGDKDPLLARLLAAATAGASPAGPANKRKPVRIVLHPDAHPVAKGNLCGQHAGFNLHAATRVAANDKQGRLALCKYILRPPLANDRLKILDDKVVRLEFIVMGTLEGFPTPSAMVRGEQSSPAPHACPWSDGDGRGEAAWGRGWVGRP
ncbi:MAG TPA: hypothetical protein VJ801_03345 [Polyangia bacterium]|nr:hypothetical protein [Polyangia bacterium]